MGGRIVASEVAVPVDAVTGDADVVSGGSPGERYSCGGRRCAGKIGGDSRSGCVSARSDR